MTTLDPCGYITSSTIFWLPCGAYEEPCHLPPSWHHPYQNVLDTNSSCHALIKMYKNCVWGPLSTTRLNYLEKGLQKRRLKEFERHALLHDFVSTREQPWKKNLTIQRVWEVWKQFYLICPGKVLPNYLSRLQL